MKDLISIPLPVNNYIKKYLIATYGDEYKVRIADSFGILILNILQKKSIYYDYKKEKDNRCTSYPIFLSISNFEKYGCAISEQRLYLIHKSLDADFRKSMYHTAIINFHKFGIQYKKSIETFLKSFNIDEDELSYGTIRRDFNRKKAKIEAALKLKKR